MELQVPAAIKAEHLELRAELDKAVRAGGMLGDAAEAVAHLLYPHLEEEEEYVLPPLSILPLLTGGEVTPEMGASLPMTNKLRAELPNLVQDHKAIDAELVKLARVAREELNWEYACYVDKFRSIAQFEERVLYPAVLLIGRYVRLNLDE
jgi:hypothetical protein